MSALNDPSLVIILATATTGLGHLRVTDALYHGLPEHITPLLLGAQDKASSGVYRFFSVHSITRGLMEMTQSSHGPGEIFAKASRIYLRRHTKLLYQQLVTILNERLTVPKNVLIVATHTMLAHQLGAVKQKLEKETGVHVIFVVQVTDDSPQPIWYIPEADMIFVPSEHTKKHLLAYAAKNALPKVPITVIPYPISPLLTEPLSDTAFAERRSQTDPDTRSTIHISVPVSGAAVGTAFITNIIPALHALSSRFFFHIVSKDAPYTATFLEAMHELPYASPLTSTHDRSTVDNYESIFKQNTVGYEITKPSEQAFKALALPKQRGGAILLFSKPVGQQEYDNLNFLRKHRLLPEEKEQQYLWGQALLHKDESKRNMVLLKQSIRHWRAMYLPESPDSAARFILWCLRQNIFADMVEYTQQRDNVEVSPNGVKHFWEAVGEVVEKRGT